MRRVFFALVLVLAACRVSEQPGRAVFLDVPFEDGRYAVTPRADAVLDTLAAALLDPRLAGESFVIRDAVAPQGDAEASLRLSRLRAASIVDRLVARGVPRTRLSYDGLGADPKGERVEVIASD